MKPVKLSPSVLRFINGVNRNLPAICTGIGITGFIASLALAINAAPKASEDLSASGIETLRDAKNDIPLTCGIIARYYWPMALTASTAIAAVIFAQSTQTRRYASLLATYSLSETALESFKNATEQIVSPKEYKAVNAAADQEFVDRNEVLGIINTGQGTDLCLDKTSGRYFYSSLDAIYRAETAFNRRLYSEMYLSVNDLYDELDLPYIDIGSDLGFDIDAGPLEMEMSAALAPNQAPCIVLNFRPRLKPLNFPF